MVSLLIARDLQLDIKKTFFTVSENAATTAGTTAYLKPGQRLRIIDLLHGLMLPSGNDAAVTLAENFGDRLKQIRVVRNATASTNKAIVQTASPLKLRDSRMEVVPPEQ